MATDALSSRMHAIEAGTPPCAALAIGLFPGYVVAVAIGAFGAVSLAPSVAAQCTVNLGGPCYEGSCAITFSAPDQPGCNGGRCAVNVGFCGSGGTCALNLASQCWNDGTCAIQVSTICNNGNCPVNVGFFRECRGSCAINAGVAPQGWCGPGCRSVVNVGRC